MTPPPRGCSERRIQFWDDLTLDERFPAHQRLRALALYVGRSAHGATVALADLRTNIKKAMLRDAPSKDVRHRRRSTLVEVTASAMCDATDLEG